ncbi:helix-turn-helix transcriptional regulator [Streptomyces sp. B1866]|uniref:helix-turn-helix domain-containing protein n=1 Tax=Streptomyces sp. B1866 TaxID=3075431 RepID=UPI00288FC6F1|nr:helix-turn-helix transcriptional regulator [Streptomyces sp. B1866]MDT3396190.1 helix-turn-helix transcriptional regulator [Streptomyces sp. B1866]
MRLGETIKAARNTAKMSQSQLAQALNEAANYPKGTGPVTRHEVSRWETGKRRPRDWWRLIEEVLDVDLSGYLGGEPDMMGFEDESEVVGPVERRNFVGASTVAGLAVGAPAAAAKGRRVGQADVDRFRQRIADLRRLDDYSGGTSVFPLAVAEIQRITELASSGSYTHDVGRGLFSALAETYQFASWVAFDAGRLKQARTLAIKAGNAAHQADDRTLAATALSELSYLTASSDNPGEGPAMARASLANAPSDVLPAVRVVLADRLAWAYARVGNEKEAARALGLSEFSHDQRDGRATEEPDMVYWINRDESMIMAGRCWAELNQSTKAIPVLESLTAPYDETHAREVALYQVWLADAYLDVGDIEQSTHSASRAVELSQSTASLRTNKILAEMLSRFKPHRNARSVRELLDHYQAAS